MNHLERIRSFLAEGSKPPSRDWAHKIMDDPHATELQRRMAKDALAPRYRRNRTAGDDDDEG